MKGNLFFILFFSFIFGQTVQDYTNEGKKMSEMELSVDKEVSNENLRRDIYGRTLKKFVPGYRNYSFHMTEEELRQTIVANKIVTNGTEIKEGSKFIYYKDQSNWDYIHYDGNMSKSYEFSFVGDLTFLKENSFNSLFYMKPQYLNDYKELVVEPNEAIPTEWRFRFLLVKKNSRSQANTNSYRLIGITMEYVDLRINEPNAIFNLMPRSIFDETLKKANKDLGVPKYVQNKFVGSVGNRKTNYYTQQIISRKVRSQEGLPVGGLQRGDSNLEIAVSYLEVGKSRGNFKVFYGEAGEMREILEKMQKATARDYEVSRQTVEFQ